MLCHRLYLYDIIHIYPNLLKPLIPILIIYACKGACEFALAYDCVRSHHEGQLYVGGKKLKMCHN